MTKRILVCGGTGFLGTHLVNRLVAEGHEVHVVDRKYPEFEQSSATRVNIWDLRYAPESFFTGMDECYQLACEVGGLGYIMNPANDATMLHNSSMINLSVLEACRKQKVPKIFFASSACVYSSLPSQPKDMGRGERFNYVAPDRACRESEVPPYNGDNEYAAEKFFSERLYMAYARAYGIQVRLGRIHNTFGTLGSWTGGREKAPAALCRKVAEAADRSEIEIWGSGDQTRSFTYVDDTVEGIIRLMASDYDKPVNIGSSQMVTVKFLADTIMGAAGKRLKAKTVEGPVGVQGRNSDNTLCREVLNWEPLTPLSEGIAKTYPWIKAQVDKARAQV